MLNLSVYDKSHTMQSVLLLYLMFIILVLNVVITGGMFLRVLLKWVKPECVPPTQEFLFFCFLLTISSLKKWGCSIGRQSPPN